MEVVDSKKRRDTDPIDAYLRARTRRANPIQEYLTRAMKQRGYSLTPPPPSPVDMDEIFPAAEAPVDAPDDPWAGQHAEMRALAEKQTSTDTGLSPLASHDQETPVVGLATGVPMPQQFAEIAQESLFTSAAKDLVGYTKHFVSSNLQGVAEGLTSAQIKGLSILSRALEKRLPGIFTPGETGVLSGPIGGINIARMVDTSVPGRAPLYEMGLAIEDWIEEALPEKEEEYANFITQDVAYGLGSTVVFALGGRYFAPFLGTMMASGEAYEDAIANGATHEDALMAASDPVTILGGVSEAFPVGALISRSRKFLTAAPMGKLAAGTIQLVEEGVQEMIQRAAQNYAIRNNTEVDRGHFDGMWYSGGVGGVVGFLMGFAAAGFMRKVARKRFRKQLEKELGLKVGKKESDALFASAERIAAEEEHAQARKKTNVKIGGDKDAVQGEADQIIEESLEPEEAAAEEEPVAEAEEEAIGPAVEEVVPDETEAVYDLGEGRSLPVPVKAQEDYKEGDEYNAQDVAGRTAFIETTYNELMMRAQSIETADYELDTGVNVDTGRRLTEKQIEELNQKIDAEDQLIQSQLEEIERMFGYEYSKKVSDEIDVDAANWRDFVKRTAEKKGTDRDKVSRVRLKSGQQANKHGMFETNEGVEHLNLSVPDVEASISLAELETGEWVVGSHNWTKITNAGTGTTRRVGVGTEQYPRPRYPTRKAAIEAQARTIRDYLEQTLHPSFQLSQKAQTAQKRLIKRLDEVLEEEGVFLTAEHRSAENPLVDKKYTSRGYNIENDREAPEIRIKKGKLWISIYPDKSIVGGLRVGSLMEDLSLTDRKAAYEEFRKASGVDLQAASHTSRIAGLADYFTKDFQESLVALRALVGAQESKAAQRARETDITAENVRDRMAAHERKTTDDPKIRSHFETAIKEKSDLLEEIRGKHNELRKRSRRFKYGSKNYKHAQEQLPAWQKKMNELEEAIRDGRAQVERWTLEDMLTDESLNEYERMGAYLQLNASQLSIENLKGIIDEAVAAHKDTGYGEHHLRVAFNQVLDPAGARHTVERALLDARTADAIESALKVEPAKAWEIIFRAGPQYGDPSTDFDGYIKAVVDGETRLLEAQKQREAERMAQEKEQQSRLKRMEAIEKRRQAFVTVATFEDLKRIAIARDVWGEDRLDRMFNFDEKRTSEKRQQKNDLRHLVDKERLNVLEGSELYEYFGLHRLKWYAMDMLNVRSHEMLLNRKLPAATNGHWLIFSPQKAVDRIRDHYIKKAQKTLTEQEIEELQRDDTSLGKKGIPQVIASAKSEVSSTQPMAWAQTTIVPEGGYWNTVFSDGERQQLFQTEYVTFLRKLVPGLQIQLNPKPMRAAMLYDAKGKHVGLLMPTNPEGVQLPPKDFDPATDNGPNASGEWGSHASMARLATPTRPPIVTKPKQLVAAPDVINALAEIPKAAGRMVPIRVGRIRTRNALGVFKVFPQVVRLRTANDIEVAAHEIGHALEVVTYGYVNGSPWRGPRITRDMEQELHALGKALYGDRKPNGGYKREGFAEYSAYLLLTDQAPQKAPRFHKWFTSEFLPLFPEVRDKILAAKRLAGDWYNQNSLEVAMASVRWKRPMFANLRALTRTDVSKEIWDEQSPILRLVEEAQKVRKEEAERMGLEYIDLDELTHEEATLAIARRNSGAPVKTSLRVSENPYLVAKALGVTHSARLQFMMNEGMVNIAGYRTGGMSLRDAVAPVRAAGHDFYDFSLYLYARRAMKLWEGTGAPLDDADSSPALQEPKPPRNPGIGYQEAQELYHHFDSREMRIAASNFYAWWDGVMDYAQVAFGSELINRIRGGDVGSYIPLQRVFDDIDHRVWQIARSGGISSSAVTTGQIAKRLRGSGRRVRNPIQTLIENAERLVLATHQRHVLNLMIRMAEGTPGLGQFIEEVPKELTSTTIPVGRIAEALYERGFIDEDTIDDITQNHYHELATFFMPAIRPKGMKDAILPIWRDGQMQWFQFDPMLYEAVAGMDQFFFGDTFIGKAIDLVFGRTARLFRLGTTGLRPVFSLGTNVARDLGTWFEQTVTGANPAQMMAAWAQSVKDVTAATAAGDPEKWPFYDLFLAMGAEIAQPLGIDTRFANQAAKELFIESRALRTLKTPVDHARHVLQIGESATRVAELRLLAKEVGWNPGTPLTMDQSVKLLLGAKRATVDFSAAGRLSKQANQLIPFFNATVQGNVSFARAMRDNPLRAILTGLSLSVLTLRNWWDHKDEEWYNELPLKDRMLYWWIPMDDEANGNLIRIPRPFEWGLFFTVLPEAIAQAWYSEDPEVATKMLSHMVDTVNPLDLPVPMRVAAELLANKKFFFDTPIDDESIDPGERLGPYTSLLAQKLGKMFPQSVSPKRVDHVIEGFTGGLGRDTMRAVDQLLRWMGVEPRVEVVDRSPELSDIPVIGPAFVKRGGKGFANSRTIQTFYDRLGAYDRRRRSTINPETEEERDIRLTLIDASKAMRVLRLMRNRTEDRKTRAQLEIMMREIAREALIAETESQEEIADRRQKLYRQFGRNDELRRQAIQEDAARALERGQMSLFTDD